MPIFGTSPNHSKDVYRMLNLDTKRVILSRDITWLGKMYGEWKGLSNDKLSFYKGDTEDDDDSDNDP